MGGGAEVKGRCFPVLVLVVTECIWGEFGVGVAVGDEGGGGESRLEEVETVFDGPCDLVDCLPVAMGKHAFNVMGTEIVV